MIDQSRKFNIHESLRKATIQYELRRAEDIAKAALAAVELDDLPQAQRWIHALQATITELLDLLSREE